MKTKRTFTRLLATLLCCFVLCTGYGQTKPTLTIKLKYYIEEQTANYYGGKTAVQDSVNRQITRVNALFNSHPGFNRTYNFTVTGFKYYKEQENADSTQIISHTAPEANNVYRVVLNAFPKYDKGWIAYDIGYQTLTVSYLDSATTNGGVFGRIMTNTVAHELSHSRGAYDIGAGELDGDKNAIIPGAGWRSMELSVMNLTHGDYKWDTHSTYMMNQTAVLYGANFFTYAQWNHIANTAFPQTFGVLVKGTNGAALANATVKFYGIPWLRDHDTYVLSGNPTFTLTTDNAGQAKFSGSIASNPYGASTDVLLQYHIFLVTVTVNNVKKYAWMPYYEVSNAFINGQTSYFKTISFSTSLANSAPTVILSEGGKMYGYAPMTTAFPIHAYDLDGTIASVKVYDNGTYVGDAELTASYNYWYWPNNLSAGRHNFTATVTDNSGASVQSNTLRFDVLPANKRPKVWLTSPVHNATYTGSTLTISGGASDSDGSVSRVELYASGSFLTSFTTSSFSYNWTNVAPGKYTISAKVIDNKGGDTMVTAYVKVTAQVTCTAPAWNAGTAYVSGNEVVYAGIRYRANWWTQNERPDLNNGGAGSGKPWTSLGTCNTRQEASYESTAMDLYPNPASQTVNIRLNNDHSGSTNITVYDHLSVPVLSKEVYIEAGVNLVPLDLTPLQHGIYTVSIVSGDDKLVRQLVIAK